MIKFRCNTYQYNQVHNHNQLLQLLARSGDKICKRSVLILINVHQAIPYYRYFRLSYCGVTLAIVDISDINYVSINNCHGPTPALAKLGGKDPTPPRPTTNTFAFAIYQTLFFK
jgi:hypothetical protein